MEEKMKFNYGNFLSFYKEFYKGNRSEQDMTLLCTQPFWQSIILGKKRLDEKGLRYETEFIDERAGLSQDEVFHSTNIDTGNVMVSDMVERQNNVSATMGKHLLVTRKIMRGNDVMYKDSGKRLVSMTQIKENVDSENVACPNCGHVGTISSYIDGCDYCHTKFNVLDFEEKVSSLEIQGNTDVEKHERSSKIFKVAKKGFLITFFLQMLLVIGIIVYDIVGDDNPEVNKMMDIAMIIGMVIAGVFLLLLLIHLFRAMITFFSTDREKLSRISSNGVLEKIYQHVPGFSAEAFAQNLEMKLRNIHFADKAEEVNVFAHVDLFEAVATYSDVIECNLSHVEFLDYMDDGITYQIALKAKVELLRYDGVQVKNDVENIIITMSGISGVNEEDIRAVTMYKCDSCGSSVSLLNGGVCAHCGQRLPYEKYSLIIEKYYANMSGEDIRNADKLVQVGKYKR